MKLKQLKLVKKFASFQFLLNKLLMVYFFSINSLREDARVMIYV